MKLSKTEVSAIARTIHKELSELDNQAKNKITEDVKKSFQKSPLKKAIDKVNSIEPNLVTEYQVNNLINSEVSKKFKSKCPFHTVIEDKITLQAIGSENLDKLIKAVKDSFTTE